MDLKWEKISTECYRVKINGGWLVLKEGYHVSGLTFVPDKKHEWA